MKFFDVQSPVFRPVWLRLLVVVLCLGWAGFEAVAGSGGWAVLFGAAGVYLGYQFFVVFDPDQKKDSE